MKRKSVMAILQDIRRDVTTLDVNFNENLDCSEIAEYAQHNLSSGRVVTFAVTPDKNHVVNFQYRNQKGENVVYLYHTVVQIDKQGESFIVDLTSDIPVLTLSAFVGRIKYLNCNLSGYIGEWRGLPATIMTMSLQVMAGGKKITFY